MQLCGLKFKDYMEGSSGFTILFDFNDTANEFSFINGQFRFQAYVHKKDLDAPVYYVSRLNRYDVYEITALIASYQLVRTDKTQTGFDWMEIRTRENNTFIDAIGQAIDEQERAGVKLVY